MLIPLVVNEEDINDGASDEILESSKTYRLDFETGDIVAEFIDYEEAIQQAAVKAVRTIRERYYIYSTDYGCEINDLLGQSYSKDYLDIEVPRLIEECLLVDDRITNVVDFIVDKTGDELNISFTIETSIGDIVGVEVTV